MPTSQRHPGYSDRDDGLFSETTGTRLEGESKVFRNVVGNDSGPYAEFCTLVSSPDQWRLFDGYLYDGEKVIAAVTFGTEVNCRALIDAANSSTPEEPVIPEALTDLILKYQDRIHDERELADWYDGPLFIALRDFAREIVPATEHTDERVPERFRFWESGDLYDGFINMMCCKSEHPSWQYLLSAGNSAAQIVPASEPRTVEENEDGKKIWKSLFEVTVRLLDKLDSGLGELSAHMEKLAPQSAPNAPGLRPCEWNARLEIASEGMMNAMAVAQVDFDEESMDISARYFLQGADALIAAELATRNQQEQ